MKKVVSLALSLVMVLGLFAGCVPKSEEKNPAKDPGKTEGKVRTDIVVAWKGDVVSPDPQKMNDTVSQRDNHSSNKGGVIPNAAWEMVRFLNTMVDKEGKCTVEGFYDNVRQPSDYDIQLMEALPYDPVETAKVFGVKEINLSKQDFYRNIMFRPTFSINGLVSGYHGSGDRVLSQEMPL